MFEVSVKAGFSGAHRLKGYRGKCENIHGHNWEVEIFAALETLNKEGLSIDFRVLKRKLRAVLAELDHCDLNKIIFFRQNNPSAENIARYIYLKLKGAFGKRGPSLKRVAVWETKDSRAIYYE